MTIVATCDPLIFCSAKKFAKQYFLLKIFLWNLALVQTRSLHFMCALYCITQHKQLLVSFLLDHTLDTEHQLESSLLDTLPRHSYATNKIPVLAPNGQTNGQKHIQIHYSTKQKKEKTFLTYFLRWPRSYNNHISSWWRKNKGIIITK